MNISVIVPTYNREQHLKNCLLSILNQTQLPLEVIVVDNANHNKAELIINNLLSEFNSKGISLFYFRNYENSGATARNLGANAAKGDLIAFLDDDVILDNTYYHEIVNVFLNNPRALGVQGYDKALYKFNDKMSASFINRLIYSLEKIFSISNYFDNKPSVTPSLCVTNPFPNFESVVRSEWISTCAGVFSREVFDDFQFDPNFKKYSWNEYLYLSYSVFLKNPDSLFITPNATYIDVQTNSGRLKPKELFYMSEVYDMYIFLRVFDLTAKNISLYIWSKLGRVLYNSIRIIVRQPSSFSLILHCFYAPIYTLLNLSKIRNGDLSFFNKTLS